jgi:secondary thiamine-phosphate synthase enzyme
MVEFIQIQTTGQGLFEITDQVLEVLYTYEIRQGLCTLFVRHTSASLTIQENADPSAKRDLEYFLNKLVPENDPGFTHTLEGADDMPSHIKAALTSTSLSIPIYNGGLVLGTWQGIYLWEHRTSRHTRSVAVHVT